jgi:hypothetical protein
LIRAVDASAHRTIALCVLTVTGYAYCPQQDVLGSDVQWIGTYYQDNISRSYPMELSAAGSSDGFTVTLGWPTLSDSRTKGHGTSTVGSVSWIEEQLVQGRGIILDGRYEAILLDPDTLVGIYEHDGRRMGSFTLSRTRIEKASTEWSESPLDEFATLQHEYSDALSACLETTHALPVAHQRAYYQTHEPSVDSFAKRFRTLADTSAKSAVAARALEWIVEHDRATPDAYEAVERLIAGHGSSVELGRACLMLSYDASLRAKDLLERVRTQSQSSAVRGKATYALAEYWLSESERQTALDARGSPLGCIDAAKCAEGLFEAVAKEYGEEEYFANRTLGDTARAALLQMRKLAIGSVAPEIDAEDLDGVTFKLSDYRGKVVVLDFWGHW